MSDIKEYKGCVEKIFCDKGEWCAGLLRLDTDAGKTSVRATGCLNLVPLNAPAVFTAETAEDPKYGKQLKVVGCYMVVDETKAGVLKFLTSGFIKGIGEKKAAAIYNTFGPDSVRIIAEESSRLCEVPGISVITAKKIADSYSANFGLLELVKATKGMLTPYQIQRLNETYGPLAPEIIKTTPYQVIKDISGFGFKKADQIAKATGIDDFDIARVGAAVSHVLFEAAETDGHCYLDVDTIERNVVDLLCTFPSLKCAGERAVKNALSDWDSNRERFMKAYRPSEEELSDILKWERDRNEYISVISDAMLAELESGDIINEDGRIYQKTYFNAETCCASKIKEMLNNASPYIPFSLMNTVLDEYTDKYGNKLSIEQRKAAEMALTHNVCAVTGGPGTGKTSTIQAIAKVYIAHHGVGSVILLAPTGRAAQRMTEATGLPAMTIHRYVATRSGDRGKLCIVDEMSMVDILLFAQLLNAIHNNSAVFVGDIDQLASVGAGAVLKDLLMCSAIPNVRFTTVYRTAGSPEHNARLLNTGHGVNEFCFDEHFKYVPVSNEMLQKTVVDTYNECASEVGKENVLLIVPMRKRGTICTSALNMILQEKFTDKKDAVKCGVYEFRKGDRVMHLKNEYKRPIYKLTPTGPVHSMGVFNGELGTVVKVDPDDCEITVLFDIGIYSVYSGNEMSSLELAYAITVHKSQGSEAQKVIYAGGMENFVMLKRNLLYTAVTRAKKDVILIDEKSYAKGYAVSAADMAIKNIDERKRNTSLCERILTAMHGEE